MQDNAMGMLNRVSIFICSFPCSFPSFLFPEIFRQYLDSGTI